MKKKSKKAKSKTKSRPKAKKVSRVKAKPKKAKKAKSKVAKKKQPAKAKLSVIPPPNSVLLGRVEDYYAHINVIALTLKGPVHQGDQLHILGHTTHLEQTADSMQINHQPVTEAKAKDAVGIKVNARVRRGDYVFLIR